MEKTLFDPATYAGCQVERLNERDALVVSGVRGTQLRIRFQKVIRHWSVELAVYVANGGGEWTVFMSGQKLTKEHKALWKALADMDFHQRQQQHDGTRQIAIDILSK